MSLTSNELLNLRLRRRWEERRYFDSDIPTIINARPAIVVPGRLPSHPELVYVYGVATELEKFV